MVDRLRHLAGALLVSLAVLCGVAVAAAAAGRGRAGDFDFWVLSLSWSPSWCEAVGDAHREVQCSRPYGFVVHGLWPQWDRGFPSDCPTGEAPPSPDLVRSMLDLMPSPALVRHEWQKHGTCSGLSADRYFRAIRRLFATIRVPADYAAPERPRLVAPVEVERAFARANPGLDGDEIAVFCGGRRLDEVRICVNRDLTGFRACPEVDRRACRLDRALMPAARAGR
jgi:ribonuclease T2